MLNGNVPNDPIWKDKYFDRNKAVKYSVLFLVLLFNTTFPLSLSAAPSPFCTGFVIGAAYSGVALLFLFPAFALSAIAVVHNTESVVCVLIVSVVLSLAHLIRKKIKKSPSLAEINLLSFLLGIAVSLLCGGDLYSVIAYVACQTFYTNAVKASICWFFDKSAILKPALDEKLSLALVYAVTATGLFCVDVFSIKPYYVFIPAFLMFLNDVYKVKTALILACLSGLGVFILQGNYGFCTAFVLCVMVSSVFTGINVFFVALSFSASYAALCIYSPFTEIAWYKTVLFVCFGTLFYACIPGKVRTGFKKIFANKETDFLHEDYYLRAGSLASEKLKAVSKAFFNMGRSVSATVRKPLGQEETVNEICAELEREICVGCKRQVYCKRAVGQTAKEFYYMAQGAYKRGVPYTDEIGSFLETECINVNKAVAFVTQAAARYRKKELQAETFLRSKSVIARQAEETGNLLSDLANETEKDVYFKKDTERDLDALFKKNGIPCGGVVCFFNGGRLRVEFTVPVKDAQRPVIPLLVCKATGVKMTEDQKILRDGWADLRYVSAPGFEILFSAKIASSTQELSGDSKTVKKIGADKALIVLSDGMGRGNKAERTGSGAVELLESYFSAGFSPEKATSLSNAVMALNQDDDFSAMDIGLADLNAGTVTFIKYGSPPSFFISGNRVEKVENKSLPFGIVGKLKTVPVTKKVKNKDMVVWVSDGVYDALGEGVLIDLIMQNVGLNPEKITSAISGKLGINPLDDSSCVCIRFLSVQ